MHSRYSTLLVVIFLSIYCLPAIHALPSGNQTGDCKLIYFYSETCPHCHDERSWLEGIKSRYPTLEVIGYESDLHEELFNNVTADYGTTPAGVPMTFVDDKAFVGFSGRDGLLVYRNRYAAYSGSANQIENSVRDCINGVSSNVSDKLIGISLGVGEVKELLEIYPSSVSTRALSGDTYLVAWWSPERLSSKLAYPDIVVYVDKETGSVLNSEKPVKDIEILPKPGQGVTWIHVIVLSIIVLYLMAYLVLQKKDIMTGRQWLYGFMILVIIFLLTLCLTMPLDKIGGFFRDFFGLYL